MERNIAKTKYYIPTYYIKVFYNFETDSVKEIIQPYGKDEIFERESVEREYFINNWKKDVVDKYTPFIVNNITLLRGKENDADSEINSLDDGSSAHDRKYYENLL